MWATHLGSLAGLSLLAAPQRDTDFLIRVSIYTIMNMCTYGRGERVVTAEEKLDRGRANDLKQLRVHLFDVRHCAFEAADDLPLRAFANWKQAVHATVYF